MPDFLITAPDGTKYHVSGPDGATEQDALAQVQAQHSAPAVRSFDAVAGGQVVPTGSPAAVAARSPVSDSTTQNVLAGAGKAFVDVGRGTGQLVGAVSRQDVQDSRDRDAPLMATTAGKVGNVAGNVAIAAPAAFIPGANTVAGAATIGAVSGLLQPSTSTAETAENIGLGGATGAAGQVAGNALGKFAAGKLAARQTASDAAASLNSARDATLQEGRSAGYVVPPTAVNPSATNTALESISGKAATRQGASTVNQKVTNTLVKQDLGIPPTQPITRDAIQGVIAQKGAIYGQVKQALGDFTSDQTYTDGIKDLTKIPDTVESSYPGIGAQGNEDVQKLATALDVPEHTGNDAVAVFKLLNERAKDNFQAASSGADSQLMSLARAQKAGADEVGDLITRQLQKSGQGDLATQWQTARTTIAKGYQALGALKGNDVSAQVLASQLRRNKPLTGGMGVAARFADQFPDATQLPKSGVGVSKLGAAAAAMAGSAGLYAHNPMMAVPAAAAIAAPYATRGAMLSRGGQAVLARPNYAPGAFGTLALSGAAQAPQAALPGGIAADHLASLYLNGQ